MKTFYFFLHMKFTNPTWFVTVSILYNQYYKNIQHDRWVVGTGLQRRKQAFYRSVIHWPKCFMYRRECHMLVKCVVIAPCLWLCRYQDFVLHYLSPASWQMQLFFYFYLILTLVPRYFFILHLYILFKDRYPMPVYSP